MLEFHDVEQNTDEWFALRAGKLTSSNLAKIMANYGKAFGDPAKKLAANIAVERLTGNPIESEYTNAAMERGHIEEPIARALYEQQTFCDVSNGGFFCDDFIGASPDGLVGDDGVIEIKSAIPNIHYTRISTGKIDSAYRWQCAQNLHKTGRDWLDFISYCANFPEDRQLLVIRLNQADIQDDVAKITQRTAEFKSLVDECIDKIQNSPYYR